MFSRRKYKKMLKDLALTKEQKVILFNAFEEMMMHFSGKANRIENKILAGEYEETPQRKNFMMFMEAMSEGVNKAHHFIGGTLEGQDVWD